MQLLKSVGLFFIQPLFWAGILMTLISYQLRLKNERRNFRIAIDRDFYEARHFIKHGLLFLVLGSLFALIFGLSLPTQTLVLYQILAVVALLFINVGDLSLAALLVTGTVTFVVSETPFGSDASWASYILPHELGTRFGSAILLLTAILALFQAFLARENKAEWFSPKIFAGKRGRRIAGYTWREFTVFPLIMFIPGMNFDSWQQWLDPSQYLTHFMVVPLFVGAFCKIYKQQPKEALHLRQRQSYLIAFLAGLFALVAYFVPVVGFYGIAGLLLILVAQAFGRLKADHDAKRWYVETSEGVRIVAVKPETPAAKMKLEVGDIILECNGIKVATGDELYEALQKSPAYCRLKVKNFEGELKLAESAIYADSPHEIGVVLFE